MFKIVKSLLALSLLPFILEAQSAVVPDDYLISQEGKLTYGYSAEYAKVLPELKRYQEQIIKRYTDEFGFELDDRLYVGLASSNNQIANAFSTQVPFNAQLFYGAGAGYIDYFCFNSWLKTLIIHETAHNFQLNPKENMVSKYSHKILGNTPFSLLGFYPLFPIPNLLESSFILEGNAVMNESRFANGGRLYSGYALAEVVTLAKAGKITPALMYNETLEFPYAEKFYLVGGFFQAFLVKKYGVKKVNHYFKTFSAQLFPFFTNSVFIEQFGKDFETLLDEFVADIKKEHAPFNVTNTTVVAQSQLFVPLNVVGNEIMTLIGDKVGSPKILHYEKSQKKATFSEGAWRVGEVFKVDGNYYTQSSAKISPTKIKMGLYNKSAYIKEGTESKMIQGYLPNGNAVYFDIEASLEEPHIYINGKFYDTSSSSVHIDKEGNLYYFKQSGKRRMLYKNKKEMVEYHGHYGFVCDVDESGNIYFIAGTKHGSTVYRYNGSKIERMGQGDDIIECKIINGNEALVVTIGAEEYNYQRIELKPYDAKVAIYDYGLEEPKTVLSKLNKPFKASVPLPSKAYHPLTQLRYSSLNQWMGYNSYDGFLLNLQANFYDPLMQNSLSALLLYEKTRVVGGLNYSNQAYPVEFGGSVYGVNHDDGYRGDIERDHGYSAYVKFPFLATGYWRGSSKLEYIKAYDSNHRKPISLSLDISNSKQFGLSKYPNQLNYLELFSSEDRGDNSLGATYKGVSELGWQSYVGIELSYLNSDTLNPFLEKGIRISDSWGSFQKEKSEIIMPTLLGTFYAKEAKVAEVSLYKVFDTPLYFFSFPLSLQRETLYAKHKFYDFDFASQTKQYQETTVGIESDFLLLHKLPIPITFEWMYNEDVQDKSQFRVMFGAEF